MRSSIIENHPELDSRRGVSPQRRRRCLCEKWKASAIWRRRDGKGRAVVAHNSERPGGTWFDSIEKFCCERLLTALERLRHWETPIQVSPAVAEGYRMKAAQQTDPVLKSAYLNLEKALKDPALRKKLLTDSTLNAEVRNTFTITGLQGSDKVNVIPGVAWAQIDARLLPGETPEGFIAKLRRVLNDPELEIEVLEGSTPTGSSAETASDAKRSAKLPLDTIRVSR